MRKAGHRPNEYFVYAQLLAYATAKPKEVKRAEAYIREAIQAKKGMFFFGRFVANMTYVSIGFRNDFWFDCERVLKILWKFRYGIWVYSDV